MSIFKETFRPFVREQLLLREQIMKAGSLGAGEAFEMKKTINGEEVTFVGNRFGSPNYTIIDNANNKKIKITLPAGSFWTNTVSKQCVIRMCSGVDVKSDAEGGPFGAYLDEKVGSELAENWVLEGGVAGQLPKIKGTKSTYDEYGFIDGTEETKYRIPRSGIGTKGNTAYGSKKLRANANFGNDDMGIVPMPGIKDINVRTTSAYGSLRVAKVNFSCHNRAQLEVLELLYMRPGYPILIEWGWTPYINIEYNKKRTKVLRTYRETTFPYMDDFFKSSSTIEDMNQKIINQKETSGGNYDGFIGFCKNFDYKVREDGGYDCTTEVIAMGEVLDGLKGVQSSDPSNSKYLLNRDRRTKGETEKREDNTLYGRFDFDNPGYTRISELEYWLYNISADRNLHGKLATFDSPSYYSNSYTYSRGLIEDTSTRELELKKYNIAPNGNIVDFLGDLVVKIWDEEHKHIGASIDTTSSREGDQLYPYTGVTNWNGYSDEKKFNLARDWLATCGFLSMEAELEYEDVDTGVEDDPETTDVNESVKREYEKLNIERVFIRWDLFVEIINHFVIEKVKDGERLPIKGITSTVNGPIPKDFENIVNIVYTRDSLEEVNEYLTYSSFHKDETGIFPSNNPASSHYKELTDIADQSLDPLVCFGTSFFGFNQHTGGTGPWQRRVIRVNGIHGAPNKQKSHFDQNDFIAVKGNVPGSDNFSTYPLRGNNKNHDTRSVGYMYLNCDMLLETYRKIMGNLDNRKKSSLFKYINAIWDKVNHSYADTHKFNLHVDLEKPNNIRVIDLDITTGKKSEQIHELQIQSTTSAVRDFTFNTTIPSDLSATIAVAAQCPDNIDNLDKVTFKAFNQYTNNRFTKAISQEDPAETLKEQKDDFKTSLEKLHTYFENIKAGAWLSDHPSRKGFKIDEARQIVKGIEEQMLVINTKDKTTGEFKKTIATPKSAIIPLNFTCQLDGISGIVIGNIFRLPKDRLPIGYQRENIGFVVTKESQKISSGQDWITTIGGQLIFLDEETTNFQTTTASTSPVTSTNVNTTSNAINTSAMVSSSLKSLTIEIMQYFIDKGASIEAAAAIVGNMVAESGLKVDALEKPTSYDKDDGGYRESEGGVGLWQWTGRNRSQTDRKDKFEDALGLPAYTSAGAAAYKQKLRDLGWEKQADYLWDEMGSRARSSYGSASNIADAVEVIIETDIKNAAFLCWKYWDNSTTRTGKKASEINACEAYGIAGHDSNGDGTPDKFWSRNACYCIKGQTTKAEALVEKDKSKTKRITNAEKAYNTYKSVNP